MDEFPQISIVVPVHNEEQNLALLHGEIRATMQAMGARYEAIYVDDRSTDRSLEAMLALRREDPRVRVVRFRRNYGQTAALSAGFDASRGEIVVTLDGDLQNDPADIPRLVAAIRAGHDVAAGWRKARRDGFWLRRLPSIAANRLIALVTGVSIHDTGCTLKAFRREVVKRLPIYAEQHRFLPVMSKGSGARVTEVVVNHRPRRFGRSKYGIGRATRVLLDLLAIQFIAQFSQRPLHYFGLLCAAVLGVGAIGGLASWALLAGGSDYDAIEGWAMNTREMLVLASAMLVVMLLVYFALLGLLAELAVNASGMHRRSTLNRILNELH